METVVAVVLGLLGFGAFCIRLAYSIAREYGEFVWFPRPPEGERLLAITPTGVRFASRFVAYSDMSEVSNTQRLISSGASLPGLRLIMRRMHSFSTQKKLRNPS